MSSQILLLWCWKSTVCSLHHADLRNEEYSTRRRFEGRQRGDVQVGDVSVTDFVTCPVTEFLGHASLSNKNYASLSAVFSIL